MDTKQLLIHIFDELSPYFSSFKQFRAFAMKWIVKLELFLQPTGKKFSIQEWKTIWKFIFDFLTEEDLKNLDSIHFVDICDLNSLSTSHNSILISYFCWNDSQYNFSIFQSHQKHSIPCLFSHSCLHLMILSNSQYCLSISKSFIFHLSTLFFNSLKLNLPQSITPLSPHSIKGTIQKISVCWIRRDSTTQEMYYFYIYFKEFENIVLLFQSSNFVSIYIAYYSLLIDNDLYEFTHLKRKKNIELQNGNSYALYINTEQTQIIQIDSYSTAASESALLMINYQGMITNIVVYQNSILEFELDSKYRILCHNYPFFDGAKGLLIGTEVLIENGRPLLEKEKVIGFYLESVSRIKIVQFSPLITQNELHSYVPFVNITLLPSIPTLEKAFLFDLYFKFEKLLQGMSAELFFTLLQQNQFFCQEDCSHQSSLLEQFITNRREYSFQIPLYTLQECCTILSQQQQQTKYEFAVLCKVRLITKNKSQLFVQLYDDTSTTLSPVLLHIPQQIDEDIFLLHEQHSILCLHSFCVFYWNSRRIIFVEDWYRFASLCVQPIVLPTQQCTSIKCCIEEIQNHSVVVSLMDHKKAVIQFPDVLLPSLALFQLHTFYEFISLLCIQKETHFYMVTEATQLKLLSNNNTALQSNIIRGVMKQMEWITETNSTKCSVALDGTNEWITMYWNDLLFLPCAEYSCVEFVANGVQWKKSEWYGNLYLTNAKHQTSQLQLLRMISKSILEQDETKEELEYALEGVIPLHSIHQLYEWMDTQTRREKLLLKQVQLLQLHKLRIKWNNQKMESVAIVTMDDGTGVVTAQLNYNAQICKELLGMSMEQELYLESLLQQHPQHVLYYEAKKKENNIHLIQKQFVEFIENEWKEKRIAAKMFNCIVKVNPMFKMGMEKQVIKVSSGRDYEQVEIESKRRILLDVIVLRSVKMEEILGWVI